MAKGTFSREEIREQLEHDELGEALKKGADFLKRHRFTLLAAVGVIVLAIIGWQVLKYRELKALENASLEYVQASNAYDEAVFNPQSAPADRARLLDQAIQGTESLRAAYGNITPARMALYLQGKAYLAKNDQPGTSENADKAIAIFQQYIDTASTPEEKARGYLGLATAYQNRGFLKEDNQDLTFAQSAYEEILKRLPEDSYLSLEARYSLGQLLLTLDEPAQAAEAFREVIRVAGKEESTRPERAPALTTEERQRQLLEQQVDRILTYFTYANLAERALREVVPPSAEDLKIDLPGAASPSTAPAASGS